MSPLVSWLFFKARAKRPRFIRVKRATRKNSQLTAARRVALKNGPAAALLVGYVPHHFDTGEREPDLQERKMVRDAPSNASPARTALPVAHFYRNERHVISGTGH